MVTEAPLFLNITILILHNTIIVFPFELDPFLLTCFAHVVGCLICKCLLSTDIPVVVSEDDCYKVDIKPIETVGVMKKCKLPLVVIHIT